MSKNNKRIRFVMVGGEKRYPHLVRNGRTVLLEATLPEGVTYEMVDKALQAGRCLIEECVPTTEIESNPKLLGKGGESSK